MPLLFIQRIIEKPTYRICCPGWSQCAESPVLQETESRGRGAPGCGSRGQSYLGLGCKGLGSKVK